MMIWIDMPVMKPAITAFEMKFTIQPRRTSPATTKTTPAVSASADVIDGGGVLIAARKSPTTLADTAATDPAAPKTISFEPPNRA